MRILMLLLVAALCLPLLGADEQQGIGSIEGKVLNQKGKVVPDVPMKLYLPYGVEPPSSQPTKGGKRKYIEAASDKNGEFVFANLPAGEYAVIAELDGTGRGRVEAVVRANKTTRVQVMLVSRTGEKQ